MNFVYLVLIGGNLRNYARKYLDFNSRATYVVLGDSHANRAWSSNTNTSVYNFAYGSDNIDDLWSKIDYITKHHPDRSFTLVLSFEPHLISAYREAKNNNRINDVLNNNALSISTLVWFPLVFDPNTEIDTKVFIRRSVTGASRSVTNSSSLFSEKKAEERFSDQFGDGKVSARLISKYQKLIDQARNQHWRIVGLKYPVHPYFRLLIESRPAGRRLLASMDSLIVVNNLEVEDYSQRINLPNLFMDQDHLNEEGSREFLKLFFQEQKRNVQSQN